MTINFNEMSLHQMSQKMKRKMIMRKIQISSQENFQKNFYLLCYFLIMKMLISSQQKSLKNYGQKLSFKAYLKEVEQISQCLFFSKRPSFPEIHLKNHYFIFLSFVTHLNSIFVFQKSYLFSFLSSLFFWGLLVVIIVFKLVETCLIILIFNYLV